MAGFIGMLIILIIGASIWEWLQNLGSSSSSNEHPPSSYQHHTNRVDQSNYDEDAITREMTNDINSIIGNVEQALMEALTEYAGLTPSEVEDIMRDSSYNEEYISKHCTDLFSLGWMISYEERHLNRQSKVEGMGAESRETLNELLTFLQAKFSSEKVIDVFHDIGLGFFNNGYEAGKDSRL